MVGLRAVWTGSREHWSQWKNLKYEFNELLLM